MQGELYDVFISGAGPVGLYFAYKMLTMGHSIYICDYKYGPTDQTRAIGITARSMEHLTMDGIAHHFLKRAVILQGARCYSNGEALGNLDASLGGASLYPHGTMVSQDAQEEILIQLVEGLEQGTIRWGTSLINYEEHQDHVEAIVCKDDGTTYIVKSKYMIGADGTHSVVRKKYTGSDEWRYDGKSIATRFALADVTLTGRDAKLVNNNRGNIFTHPDGVCGFIPLHGPNSNHFRIACNLGFYELTDKKEPTHGISRNEQEALTLEEIRDIVAKRVAPLELIPTDPTWLTIFRINERKANGYRRGRMFVMGDAAHCHSPIGGQGLNLGLQDAQNLAWKLSLVLKGKAKDPESLLNSYSIEREPVAEGVMTATGSLTKAGISKLSFIHKWMASCAFYAVTSFERLQSYMAKRMMGLHLQVNPESPIYLPSTLGDSGSFIPNTAAMQRRVVDNQVIRQSMHEILSGIPSSKHVLVWIASRLQKDVACPLSQDFWNKTRERQHVAHRVVIESVWHAHHFALPPYAADDTNVDNDFWLEANPESTESLSTQIGLNAYMKEENPPAALVVLRPDSYIACSLTIRSSQDIDTALQSLESYLIN
ncbi:hypothetical protein K492DRAFT_187760 [Lichtheimia hyalospora FSU 10163]|nr:hypothetical protein K492DRAFT_187760 [Lichtheimia hyalospora FSU 10163]